MSVTNLAHPLTKRYAGLSGQILMIERKIREAELVLATVPELRAQIAQKHDLMVHIAGIMREIDPNWDPKAVQPIKPHAYSLPFKYGDCTILAYDVLRQAARWLTIKEVVKEVFRQQGIQHETALYIKIASNVGAGFNRRRKRGEIECDKTATPQRWRVASKKSAVNVK